MDADSSEYPLNDAVDFGEYETTVVLLEAGADPNVRSPYLNDTPLIRALSYGGNEYQYRIAMLLLKYGADPNVSNDDGDTPFELAKQENPDGTKKMKKEQKQLLEILENDKKK